MPHGFYAHRTMYIHASLLYLIYKYILLQYLQNKRKSEKAQVRVYVVCRYSQHHRIRNTFYFISVCDLFDRLYFSHATLIDGTSAQFKSHRSYSNFTIDLILFLFFRIFDTIYVSSTSVAFTTLHLGG